MIASLRFTVKITKRHRYLRRELAQTPRLRTTSQLHGQTPMREKSVIGGSSAVAPTALGGESKLYRVIDIRR